MAGPPHTYTEIGSGSSSTQESEAYDYVTPEQLRMAAIRDRMPLPVQQQTGDVDDGDDSDDMEANPMYERRLPPGQALVAPGSSHMNAVAQHAQEFDNRQPGVMHVTSTPWPATVTSPNASARIGSTEDSTGNAAMGELPVENEYVQMSREGVPAEHLHRIYHSNAAF